MNDEIVEEVRRHREAYSERFGHDLWAMYRDLKEQEQRSGRQVVSFPPRPVDLDAIRFESARSAEDILDPDPIERLDLQSSNR